MCVDWQRLLLGCVYTTARFRRRVRNGLFKGLGTPSKLVFTLEVDIRVAMRERDDVHYLAIVLSETLDANQ